MFSISNVPDTKTYALTSTYSYQRVSYFVWVVNESCPYPSTGLHILNSLHNQRPLSASSGRVPHVFAYIATRSFCSTLDHN